MVPLTKRSFKFMVVPAAPRLVAFDLDGTLLDSTEAIVMSVKECWKACGGEVGIYSWSVMGGVPGLLVIFLPILLMLIS